MSGMLALNCANTEKHDALTLTTCNIRFLFYYTWFKMSTSGTSITGADSWILNSVFHFVDWADMT